MAESKINIDIEEEKRQEIANGLSLNRWVNGRCKVGH